MDLDLPWAVKLGIRLIHYGWLWRSGADARAQNVLQVVQTRVPRHRPALLRARVLRCPSRPPPNRPAVWPRWKLTTPPCGKIVPRRMDPRRMVAQVARLLAEGPFVVNREVGDQEGGLGQRFGGTEGHPTFGVPGLELRGKPVQALRSCTGMVRQDPLSGFPFAGLIGCRLRRPRMVGSLSLDGGRVLPQARVFRGLLGGGPRHCLHRCQVVDPGHYAAGQSGARSPG